MADAHPKSTESADLSDSMHAHLMADAKGEYRDSVTKTLSEEVTRLKGEMNQGLSQEDYEKANAVAQAAIISGSVVKAVWEKLHKN